MKHDPFKKSEGISLVAGSGQQCRWQSCFTLRIEQLERNSSGVWFVSNEANQLLLPIHRMENWI